MIDEPPIPFEGFLLEYKCPSGLAWRPDRFLTISTTLEDALAAVSAYVGKQIDLHVIEQGATVLSRARDLGVADGKVIGLI